MAVRVQDIAGQPDAVAHMTAALNSPVHAYLFVGPAGSGKFDAALTFAADLLDDDRAARNVHPDVVTLLREGASISVAMAREVTRLALRSPVEGSRKVLILDDFHLVSDAAPALLKTVEETPPSTVFLILADFVPKELVTIASRCVRVDFRQLSSDVIEKRLISEGVEAEVAASAASAAHGDIDQARLLAHDKSATQRMALWSQSAARLDGTGHAVATIVDELIASIDSASGSLTERQEQERIAVEEQVANKIATGQALKAVDTRHKRELRRLRTDEIRNGLVVLSETLSSTLVDSNDAVALQRANAGIADLTWASESLAFNPNETTLLLGLFTRLSQV